MSDTLGPPSRDLPSIGEMVRGVSEAAFHQPSPTTSIAALVVALLVTTFYLVSRMPATPHRRRAARVLKLLMSPRYWRSPSHRLDLLLMQGNLQAFGLLLGWAILSHAAIRQITTDGLVAAFGVVAPTSLPVAATAMVATVVLFVAYEFAYWLAHYLSHQIPALWAFHKVHHSAEVLSPLTVFRVHPVESVAFANITAIVLGIAGGVLNFAFGRPIEQIGVFDVNIILLLFIYVSIQLQHSHVWMTFGRFGLWFLSPAHHQIHHSTDPRHFNKNLGSCTTLFDRLFGTHHLPQDRRERLAFGVDAMEQPHSLTSGLLAPIGEALGVSRGEPRLTPADGRTI